MTWRQIKLSALGSKLHCLISYFHTSFMKVIYKLQALGPAL